MEAVYQLLKSEFRQFGTGGISLVLALTALLFLMAEWKRLSRGCRMYTAYAACMLVLVGNPFGYNDISTFWMETSYWKMFFLLLPAVAAAIPVTELAVGTKHVWTGALGVLTQWLKKGTPQSPAVMSEMLMRMIQSGIEEA